MMFIFMDVKRFILLYSVISSSFICMFRICMLLSKISVITIMQMIS